MVRYISYLNRWYNWLDIASFTFNTDIISMALPELTKYENLEEPSSPLYVPEEERSTWDYYRLRDGVYEY